jgi:hypothetical protein
MARSGLHLLGVIRGESSELSPEALDAELIRHADLVALVRAVTLPLPAPETDAVAVQAHHHTLDVAMRHLSVVPMPWGVVFSGPPEVARFLEHQRGALVEALSLVDDHWEFRLHIDLAESHPEQIVPTDIATKLYSELRRMARAAVPLPVEDARRFSAAFLVQRVRSRDFMDRMDELGGLHPLLSLDLTGPWPPYDFVRVTP